MSKKTKITYDAYSIVNLSENVMTSDNWYNYSNYVRNDDVITITSSNSQAFLRANLTKTSGILNHKIYARVNVKRSNETLSPYLYVIASSEFSSWHSNQQKDLCATYIDPTVDTWANLSCLSVSEEYDKLTNVMLAQGVASGNGDTLYKELIIVDLTETFGEGKEPSKEWCNEHINYFDGTTTIYK